MVTFALLYRKKTMKLPQSILEMLRNKSKLELNQPSDCEALSIDIEEVTGVHLGVNTLKRLLNILPDGTTTRISTLNLVAKYLGAYDWASLMETVSDSNSQFQILEGEVCAHNLDKGAMVEVTYLPDRKLVMEHTGDGIFRVIISVNGSLQEDDLLFIDYIFPNFPLLAKNVFRKGESLGRYSAGIKGGIQSIKLLK